MLVVLAWLDNLLDARESEGWNPGTELKLIVARVLLGEGRDKGGVAWLAMVEKRGLDESGWDEEGVFYPSCCLQGDLQALNLPGLCPLGHGSSGLWITFLRTGDME